MYFCIFFLPLSSTVNKVVNTTFKISDLLHHIIPITILFGHFHEFLHFLKSCMTSNFKVLVSQLCHFSLFSLNFLYFILEILEAVKDIFFDSIKFIPVVIDIYQSSQSSRPYLQRFIRVSEDADKGSCEQ